MFLRFSIQATLSSAVVAAAATTKTPGTIGDDEQELIHDGDSSTTKRNPFVPDKIARVPSGDAEESPEEDVQEARDDEYSGSLRNSVRGQQDSGTTTTTTTTTSDNDFGILENNVAAFDSLTLTSTRDLQYIFTLTSTPTQYYTREYQYVCDSNPVIEVDGEDFYYLVDDCLNCVAEECVEACPYANVRIGCWDTSRVTDMSYAFYAQTDFGTSSNDDISSWDTSNVEYMTGMFEDAYVFNIDIGDWVTKKVKSLKYTFFNAYQFNQDIGGWNTRKVKDMEETFYSNYAFNADLSGWNTTKVTTMRAMFGYCYEFNNPVGNWDVSKVENFSEMFRKAKSFDQKVSSWDTSSAYSMYGMFYSAEKFNQSVGSWDVSNVDEMDSMFEKAYLFSKKLSDWDVGKVTTMSYMFYAASTFNRPIDDWNVTLVQNFTKAFYAANLFTQCLTPWATTVPDDVDTTEMFVGTSCPFKADPLYGIRPWCQFCDPPYQCEDTQEEFVISSSCDQLSTLPSGSIRDLCKLPWGLGDMCPTLCPRKSNPACYCTDFSVAFQFGDVSCAGVAALKPSKREKKCNKNFYIAYNCPSVCNCDPEVVQYTFFDFD